MLSCTSSPVGAALVDACMMCWETAAVRWDAVQRALRDMLVRREETNMARLQRSPRRIDVTASAKAQARCRIRTRLGFVWPRRVASGDRESACSDAPLFRPMQSTLLGTRISLNGHVGTVRYVGPVATTPGIWLGVDWDSADRGKNDGSKDGKQYFTCRLGLFLPSAATRTAYFPSTATKRQDHSSARRHTFCTVYHS